MPETTVTPISDETLIALAKAMETLNAALAQLNEALGQLLREVQEQRA